MSQNDSDTGDDTAGKLNAKLNQDGKKTHEVIADVKRRADEGPILLQYSFRPFFMFAGMWAALAIPLWLATFAGFPIIPDSIDPVIWHQHEMLFGFAAAAITGFILTAIPNWTGRLPVSGWRLGVLVGLWVLGRAAMLLSGFIGPIATAIFDLAFLTLLSSMIGRELVSGKNWRNLPVLALITLFTAGNFMVHSETTGIAELATEGIRLSIFVLAVLVALIGGRIVPSFTRNWLKRKGETSLPAPIDNLDKAALAAIVLVLIFQAIWPDNQVTAAIALLAGVLHAVRLARWKALLVLSEPLMWVLHLGYAWIVVGLFLIGLAGFVENIPESAAFHALTTGGFGTMIVAVMTRASLGHTGRDLTANTGTTVVFILIAVAALSRVVAPFLDDAQMLGLWISGSAWTAAFVLYSIVYWPVFTQPRVQQRMPNPGYNLEK